MNIETAIKKYRRTETDNSKNYRLLFYALLIGLVVGLVSAVFRIILSYIENFRGALFENSSNSGFVTWLWPVVFSIAGISIALFLVRKFAPETSGSGVHEIDGYSEPTFGWNTTYALEKSIANKIYCFIIFFRKWVAIRKGRTYNSIRCQYWQNVQ